MSSPSLQDTRVFINDISTAVPETEVNELFLREAPKYLKDPRKEKLFSRMAAKGQIDRRYSVLPLEKSEDHEALLDIYQEENFPSTEKRMKLYQKYALPLARKAIAPLEKKYDLKSEVTHVIITSCTGFYAPGLDIELVSELGLSQSVERSIIGFMGCYAAFNGMKQARHIVRSQPDAKVLLVNIELCTLHFQESQEIEPMLGFLIFADGCAASLISAENTGLELQSFNNYLCSEEVDKITWQVGNQGFNMFLSTEVPKAIGKDLEQKVDFILGDTKVRDVDHWAIHTGGRAILDVIQDKLGLPEEKMSASRHVLKNYGNMSSPSVMFVLKEHLYNTQTSGQGCAMAFGPGLTVESMKFFKRPL